MPSNSSRLRGPIVAGAAGHLFLKTGKKPIMRSGTFQGHWKRVGVMAVESLRKKGVKNPTLHQIQYAAHKLQAAKEFEAVF